MIVSFKRVTDDRHDGSDDLQVDLHGEAKPVEEGQDAKRDDHVVDKADDRADGDT